ncbi:MAG TPA: ferrochelatase [Vicinamibacterales bacterium]|jgi:ferrochelatase|nr:ferrochelatase [Vicinamibacterales bacterium]
MSAPFDAVLLVAFGGPLGPADVRPFLANVLRGRRVTPERIEEVAHHYELFGGVSPITELTRRQAEGLEARLAARGPQLKVFVGMRNWHPLLADTLSEMSRAGVRHALGLIMAAHRSYSSCLQYRENVRDARAAVQEAGLADIDITYAGDWHEHPRFVETWATHINKAIEGLPPHLRAAARLVFTAHSIPTPMADAYPYREQLMASARLVAERLGRSDWTLVYQSRSGRPTDPWLEPDVGDYLKAVRAAGLEVAVLCPIGFVSDHVEVLYDLDHEALGIARDIGLSAVRAETPNDDPAFIEMMVDVVRAGCERYDAGRPLTLAHSR